MSMLGAMGMPAIAMMILALIGVWALLFGAPGRGLFRR